MAGGANATQQRVVLAVVAAHPDPADERVLGRQALDDVPRVVAAGVLDEDDLVSLGQ